MPIDYEAPAPLAAAATIYNDSARRRASLADTFGGGGGGFGGRGRDFVPYDTGIQEAIFARDNMQFARERDMLDRSGVPQTAVMQAAAAARQQKDNFALQAELNEVQLSQAEKMRLQRMRNTIGEVSNDPNLSDAEKRDLITQLRTGIDPLQRRLAQEKLQQETILKEQMVQQRQVDAALTEERLKVHATKFEDRMKYFVEPNVLTEIINDLKQNIPGPFSPEEYEKMARDEAMRQGLGSSYFQQEPGKWTSMKELGGAGEGKGRTGADKSGGHPSGLSAEQYVSEYGKVVESVDRKIAAYAKKDTEGNMAGPAETQTPEWRAKAIQSEWQARQEALNQYNAAKPPEEHKGKYQSKFKRQGGSAAAASSGETPQGSGAVSAIHKQSDLEVSRLQNRTDIPNNVKWEAMQAVQVMRQLLAQVDGKPDKLDKADRAAFDKAKKYLDENVPEQRTELPKAAVTNAGGRTVIGPQPSELTGNNWRDKFWRGDLGRETFDVNKALNSIFGQ